MESKSAGRSNAAAGAAQSRRRLARTLSGARWSEYRRLLEHAQRRGYRVVSLEQWLAEDQVSDQSTLVLRHDVDQHPRGVMPMLAIERDLGITSTWYFRWRTADAKTIAAVLAAGGTVGLHYESLTRRVFRCGGSPRSVDDRLITDARRELRAEIAAFKELFGPIRSVCPHGDSRVPGVSNQVLLRGVPAESLGIEFDGNEAMRGRRLAVWLTDRTAPEGGWKDGVDPLRLLDGARTPILCLTHPNNFASGTALWLDRLLAAVLPRPVAARRQLISRTGSDSPPAPSRAVGGLHPANFAPVADALQREIRRHYAARGEVLEGEAGLNTLLTNSSFAERRTETLLDVLFRHSPIRDLKQLRVLDLGCGFGAVALVLAARGAAVTAFDQNAERFAVGATVAQQYALPVEFRRGSMEKAAFEDTYDLAVLNNSFCYVTDREARAVALENIKRALRPGGWVVMRNPNRLFPVDQFSGLPLVGMLPPSAADGIASFCGKRRSKVRLTSSWAARSELIGAGFREVVVASPSGGALEGRLAPFARYQHVVGQRPRSLRSGPSRT